MDPEVLVSGVDEDALSAPDPTELVAVLARAKAEAVAATLAAEDVVIIGCDSVLEFDGEVHGKPGSASRAVERWRRLRGASGVLRTGHHVIARRGSTERCLTRVASTTVWFADLSDSEIEAYVATGEPEQVAGAFTIDGLGGAYVRSISGDPHAVVGISLPLLRDMLTELGIAWHSLWSSPR